MEKDKTLKRIEAEKLIAIVRMTGEWEVIKKTLKALAAGGVTIIEITTTVPDAVDIVRYLANAVGRKYLVGAGTVLDEHSAMAMIEAGAEFIVSPAVIQDVIYASNRAGVPVFPGALTPTEIWEARRLGADAVKVFPASLFGPSYLKALAGPLKDIPLIPTGGLVIDNLAGYLRAGAFAIGVGGGLIDTDAVSAGDWKRVRSTARAFVDAVKEAVR
jgi:2-dehydro-3-deoxyphosphogluconate aldolase/(4S)-4-hydroxy-2-oxoglutarate aldolase